MTLQAQDGEQIGCGHRKLGLPCQAAGTRMHPSINSAMGLCPSLLTAPPLPAGRRPERPAAPGGAARSPRARCPATTARLRDSE